MHMHPCYLHEVRIRQISAEDQKPVSVRSARRICKRGSLATMEGPSVPSQAIPVSEDAYCNSTPVPLDAAGSSSPAVTKLRKLLFRRMLIGVNDGRYFLGLFHCIDKQGNIILQDAVEYRSARHSSPPTEQRCLGIILIPATCRSSCQVDCSIEEKMSLLCLE
ncbi:hypothetical protein SEVIR_4G275300v4 [Setaria viridis]|uniref:Sm domain-containing protein n=1 Tax=Setaria viridis TaxID=4556 RepID=A0A4U6V271_SETVI|nr:N-alpha-acetyltransferase 38-A, NatC auxiliary subunit isoform X2 [Setaria viridis]TKW23159.1 hypothetical protein SEVIR_4G275300v2 [Setaria viridis]TKW23161.1 hypothetical protein SEVIR_4G275300v2 [Setaria viridis]